MKRFPSRIGVGEKYIHSYTTVFEAFMSQPEPRFPIHNSLPLPSSVGQINGLQLMRALAVALVAWGHAELNLPSVQGRRMPASPIYGVDIFFVISGFILSWIVLRGKSDGGWKNAWKFLKRRMLRIFPIYWFFCLLNFIRWFHAHRPLQRGYLPCLFLLPPLQTLGPNIVVGSSWTLFFEMIFYYLISVLLLCTFRRAIPFTVAVITGAVLLGLTFDIRRPVLIFLFNPILMEFALGAVIAFNYYKFGRRRSFGICCTLLGIVLSVLLYMYHPPVAYSMQEVFANSGVLTRVGTWGLAATFLVGGIVFWSPSLASIPGQIAIALGNASYSIYLSSALVLEYFTRLEFRLAGQPSTMYALFCYQFLVLVAVMAVGWLCYDLVEWPLLLKLQKIFLRR